MKTILIMFYPPLHELVVPRTIFKVPKVFESLKLDCTMSILRWTSNLYAVLQKAFTFLLSE